jgi:hypothetical protein
LALVNVFIPLSELVRSNFIHLFVLSLHLVDVSKLLQQLLVLHLLLLVCKLHGLGDLTYVLNQLFLLFYQPFLLEVWEEHAGFLSLDVQETTDCSLDLDGREVLCSHWSGPGLLNYPLFKS